MDKEHAIAMINVIDVCAKRGAFEGPELGKIATLRAILETEAQPPKQIEEPQEQPAANEL